MKITGRDIAEQELSIAKDPTTQGWQMIGTAQGVRLQSVQADIVAAIEEHGGEATAAQVARHLGKLAHHVSRELQELVAKNVVTKGDKRGTTVPYKLVER